MLTQAVAVCALVHGMAAAHAPWTAAQACWRLARLALRWQGQWRRRRWWLQKDASFPPEAAQHPGRGAHVSAPVSRHTAPNMMGDGIGWLGSVGLTRHVAGARVVQPQPKHSHHNHCAAGAVRHHPVCSDCEVWWGRARRLLWRGRALVVTRKPCESQRESLCPRQCPSTASRQAAPG